MLLRNRSRSADQPEPQSSVRALYAGARGASVTYANTTHAAAGKVFVLSPKGGWHVADHIFGPPEANAHFGAALAVSHGVVAVGVPDRDCAAGANCSQVKVYEDLNAADQRMVSATETTQARITLSPALALE